MRDRLPVRFYFQVLLCAGLWGSAFPVIKHSYRELAVEGLAEQLVFAGARFTIAGLLVMLVSRRSVWSSLRDAPKLPLLGVALGQTYFQYVFFYYALSVSSGALGALTTGSGSLWWIVLAPVFLRSPWPSARHWIALVACFVGIAIAVYAPGAGSGRVGLGTLCFLMATLAGAVGALFLKSVSGRFGARATTALSLFGGGVLLMASGATGWVGFWSDFSLVGAGVTLYLAALSATAFTVWNGLIERYSVNLLSSFRFLIPLCGVVESAIFIPDERIGPGIVIGGAIVLGSLFLLGRGERVERPTGLAPDLTRKAP